MTERGSGEGRRPDLPTAAELMERKRQELAKWIEKNSKFLPHHIANQLTSMIERWQFVPKNVMGFLEKGFEVLDSRNYPAELLQLDSNELPEHEDEYKSYSPICAIATVIPRASLFPLRTIQETQRNAAEKEIKDMDPIQRSEMRRRGQLQINTSLGDAKDAKAFYGFPFATDIIDATEIIARMGDSQIKRDIFQRITTARLTAMADRLDEGAQRSLSPADKTNGKIISSRTGRELRELVQPANMSFILNKIGEIGKVWLEGRPEIAEIEPIVKEENLIEAAQHDPFWFVYTTDEEVNERCQELERELRQHIQDYLEALPLGSISNFREKLVGSPMGHDFLEAYLGKSLDEIFTEETKKIAKEKIEEIRKILLPIISGKASYFDVADKLAAFIDKGLVANLTRSGDKIGATKKTTATTMEDAESDVGLALAERDSHLGEIINLDTRRALAQMKKERTIEGYELQKQKQTALYWVARVIELNRVLVQPLTQDELMPLFMIFNKIGAQYVTGLFKPTERKNLEMSHIYSMRNIRKSKLTELARLFTSLSDPETAERDVTNIVAEELNRLSDPDFVELYAQFHINAGAGPISTIVLPESFTPHGQEGLTYPNRYPAARERLLRLYQDSPDLFKDAPKLARTIEGYIKKVKK